MASLIGSSTLRNLVNFVVVLCVVLGGTWAVVHLTTNHLLYKNATTAAHSWAQFLTASVTDLEQIAAGEKPSSASMAFFGLAQKSNQVFRYEIYDRSGYSLLISDHDHDQVAIVEVSEFSLEAAQASRSGQPVVGTREGTGPDQPAFFAQAFMPVVTDGRVIAIVAAYVDQTEQRRSFNNAFLFAAGSLCLLTGLSFAVPTVAWYRRTREKQVADRRIRYLAHHDALTGLVNRASERLLKSADLALYKGKADGRNCIRFFAPEMDVALQARLALEKLIREAVLHGRFVLHSNRCSKQPTAAWLGSRRSYACLPRMEA